MYSTLTEQSGLPLEVVPTITEVNMAYPPQPNLRDNLIQETAIPCQIDNSISKAENANQKNCPHYHIDIETDKAYIESCLCYSCCIVGMISAVFAVIACLLAKAKDNSSNDSSLDRLSFFPTFGFNYYEYYAVNKVVGHAAENMKVTYNEGSHSVDVCCIVMEEPHKYKIKCHNCQATLKKGRRCGSIITAMLCGLIGMGVFTLALFVFIKS